MIGAIKGDTRSLDCRGDFPEGLGFASQLP